MLMITFFRRLEEINGCVISNWLINYLEILLGGNSWNENLLGLDDSQDEARQLDMCFILLRE